jgi:hypothetical protein
MVQVQCQAAWDSHAVEFGCDSTGLAIDAKELAEHFPAACQDAISRHRAIVGMQGASRCHFIDVDVDAENARTLEGCAPYFQAELCGQVWKETEILASSDFKIILETRVEDLAVTLRHGEICG